MPINEAMKWPENKEQYDINYNLIFGSKKEVKEKEKIMTHEKFNEFLDKEILEKIKSVLSSKSADYSSGNDKLFNFKLSAEMEGITPMEALRGMWLKHRTSIRQGLDELQEDKVRPWEWWHEKAIDDINYCILMLAILYSGEL